MKIINLGNQDSIFNHFIRQIRDVNIQNDSMRFRRNIERIGELFAYEISKELEYEDKDITTPLGISTESLIKNKPVLSTILRAGLPLHQGFLNYFDSSDNAFISAYRKHKKGGDFEIKATCMHMLAAHEHKKFAGAGPHRGNRLDICVVAGQGKKNQSV